MDAYIYFNSVSDARALEVGEEDWLRGSTLISAETLPEELGDDHLAIYAKENFPKFLHYLAYLPREDHDLLLSSFCLGINQTNIGKLLQRTQTGCSSRWRIAAKKMGFFILMQGHPTQEQMEAIMLRAKQDVGIAKVAFTYRKTGDFFETAQLLDMHRPHVRRSISRASEAMIDNSDPAISGLGAYLHGLIEDKDPSGRAASKAAQRRNTKVLNRKDPNCCGQFRVKIEDPGFKSLFISKSTIFYHED